MGESEEQGREENFLIYIIERLKGETGKKHLMMIFFWYAS